MSEVYRSRINKDTIILPEYFEEKLLPHLQPLMMSPVAPVLAKQEEYFSKVRAEHHQRYKKALVIGRFQPIHYGHIYMMKQALVLAETITIGVGSANILDHDKNPFSLGQRLRMLDIALRSNEIYDKVDRIVKLRDYREDERWAQEVVEKAGAVDVIITNNNWVRESCEKFFTIVGIPLLERAVFEGSAIRTQLRQVGLLPQKISYFSSH